MKRLIGLIIATTLSLSLRAATAPRNPPGPQGIRLPSVVTNINGVDVLNHLVIGPFPVRPGDDMDKIDHMKKAGMGEDIAGVAEFSRKLKALGVRDGADEVYPSWVVMNEQRQFVDFNYVFGQPESKEKSGAVAYAAFNIKSDKEMSARLLIGCTGAPRVFVNGKRVLSIKGKRRLLIYGEAPRIPLVPGDNLVVVKIQRQEIIWGFCGHLSVSNEEIGATALAAQSSLEKSILRKKSYHTFDDPVEVAPRAVRSLTKFNGHVRSITGERSGSVVDNKVQWDKAAAGNGLHKVVLAVDGKEYYERLLVGSLLHAVQNTLQEMEALSFHLQEQGGFPTLKARLGRMAAELAKNPAGEDENSAPLADGRGRRYVHELWIAQEALMRVRRGEAAFSHVTGLHLDGFVSGIDGSSQCHQLYVPRSYAKGGKPLPLVIMLPTAVSAAKPFWQSPFLDDHHLAERLAKLAERHGVILLWSGYHNQPTGLPMESAHLAEVLEAVGRHYIYDRNRVTLMGMCSAAPLAFDACASWSGRFAGIAVLNPEFVLDQNMSRSLVATFSKRKEFREWFMKRDRMDALFKRKTPDVLIINDGGSDLRHGDMRTSKEFVAKAVRAGAPVRFEMPPHRESAHLGAWGDLIKWAAQQRSELGWKDGVPRVRRESVQDALAEKFWVVRGTAGTNEENAANAAIAEAVLAGWEKTHFAPCRLVMDSELAAEEMRGSNLVLIGNARTNAVWRELDRGLGVTITGDGVTLGGRSWAGDGIAIQACVRHPKNTARRIVVVGGANTSPEAFGTLNLSRDGWFRYAVWGGGLDGPELRDAGL